MTRFRLAVALLCLLAGLLTMVAGCAPELPGGTVTTDKASPGDLTPLSKTSLPTPGDIAPTVETAVALEATDKLAELHLVGGFAGFCDHLVVYGDGSASYFNECSGKQTDFQVEPKVFSQLVSMGVEFGPFLYSSKNNSKGADSLGTELILYGQGPATSQPNQEQQEDLLRIMTSILVQGKL